MDSSNNIPVPLEALTWVADREIFKNDIIQDTHKGNGMIEEVLLQKWSQDIRVYHKILCMKASSSFPFSVFKKDI